MQQSFRVSPPAVQQMVLTVEARAHRANAWEGPIDPSANLARRATRLGLDNSEDSRQDFGEPGRQDGLAAAFTWLLGKITHGKKPIAGYAGRV